MTEDGTCSWVEIATGIMGQAKKTHDEFRKERSKKWHRVERLAGDIQGMCLLVPFLKGETQKGMDDALGFMQLSPWEGTRHAMQALIDANKDDSEGTRMVQKEFDKLNSKIILELGSW
ncbi:hypothetical protein FE257_002101 [Aspergillus nanangensis]|uniref:Uncharacterized protein n=1 Tax=Aspergillus nanangensis TaxID=2582783 RepID=A0AAD4CTC7_ASPNN|nr:hypothetical protein FE257_002101 [Aspergillus nanangensis]